MVFAFERFSVACRGYIRYVGGAEGKRLRDELTDVTAELLRWAASQSGDGSRS